MKTKTKILSLLMAVIMIIGLMPVSGWTVEAGSPDDLSLRGPIAVSGAASNYQCIYYGGYKWRILEKNSRELFLLSDGIVENRQFNSSNSNNYFESPIRIWLNGTFAGYFSATEQSAINGNGNNDKTYLLSSNEINSYTYFPGGNADRASTGFGWWLRSPGFFNYSYYASAALVGSDGSVPTDGGVDSNFGIRPAFRLNLSSVIFTSAAVSGASATVGSDLTAATPTAGDLKLTLADSNQTLTIGDVTADSGTSGSAVTVNYSGATASASNYLCAELVSGGITYRGVIKALTNGSGTATFNLPVALTGSYTLRLWNEQYNAANTTNYACTPISKTITLNKPTISNNSNDLSFGVVGSSYTTTLSSIGGTGAYAWSATGLPDGLTINTSNGAISGTPTKAGSFSVNVSVSDGSNPVTKALTMTVYSLTNNTSTNVVITPTITVVNGVPFSVKICDTQGTLNGVNSTTSYGTITGTASGNDTVISGTLTGVPGTLTEITLGSGKIKIRAITPPSTTVVNPSFY